MHDLDQWQTVFEETVNREFKNGTEADSAHDLSHLRRVWQPCKRINREDSLEVEPLVLMAAAYFHDIVCVPKDSKDRQYASRLAAERAATLLNELSFPEDLISETLDAIRSHSFSAQLEARSSAAKIVQDADRLEALGTLGIARVFYVAGQMNSKLFDQEDPFAEGRNLDDRQYALDHFYVKLLGLQDTMQTNTGRLMAKELSNTMNLFLEQLKTELEA